MAGTDVSSIDCFPKLEFGKEGGGELEFGKEEWRQNWSLGKRAGENRKQMRS